MKSLKLIVLVLASALASIFLLSSCERVIDLKLDGADAPIPFIEAHVINQEGMSYIRVTETADFYKSTGGKPVKNAQIVVSDDKGNKEKFVLMPGDEYGVYIPENDNFKGEIGRKYTLEVKLTDRTITSESVLPAITPIDSVQVRFVKKTTFKEEGYYIYYYGTDPPNQKNWYRWQVYENDSLYDSVEDILIASDDFIKTKISNLELPYPFEEGDTVRIEQYGITEPTFLFYQQVQAVIFNDGGLFSPPPANPVTNLKGGALGIFNTASVTGVETIIKK